MPRPHELNWIARLDRRLVSHKGGKRHVLVDITAPQRPAGDGRRRPPLNLGLVIDASGSMSGAPLEAACDAARGVIAALRPDDRLTIVSFADDVIVHTDAVATDEVGRRDALHAVDGLNTRGCTNLAAGWREGCERVAIEMDRRRGDDIARDTAATQNRVILLSDGHANRGLTDPEGLALRAAGLRQRGLYTTTVGIGDGYSPTQLEVIAEHGGGRLHDAPLGEDIVAVVLGELGEILEAAANDLTLTVRHPRTASVLAFGRLPAAYGDGSVRISLGGLTCGASRQVVLQVSVPAGREGDSIVLDLEPTWRTPDGDPVTATPFTVELAIVRDAELAAELPDNKVLQRIAELWFNHLMLESTLLNSEGRYEEAERLVREARDDFQNYCRGVPGTANLVRRLGHHGNQVSAMMCADDQLDYVASSKMFLKQSPDFRINRRGGPRA